MEKNKKVESEKKLNINYLDFIKRVKESKLSIEEKNRNKIEVIYNEIVNLRFSNLERVSKRVERKELREVLERELKSRGVEINEFMRINKEMRKIINEKDNNYIVV